MTPKRTTLLLIIALVLNNINSQPNFSNIVKPRNVSVSPSPSPSTTGASNSTVGGCSAYDSKLSVEYDVQKKCKVAANQKSPTAQLVCDLTLDVVNLLDTCPDKATFESEFLELALQKVDQYEDPDEWDILGIGVAFEPYIFQGLPFFSYYTYPSGDDTELTYNYYTECLDTIGDGCTWFHQGKLRTYYEQEGGAWLVNFDGEVDGVVQTFNSFYAPIIFNARFFGLIFVDTAHD
eukprot:TRINITY_DN262_c0_g2_i3.p2 TRINITY_DN262_c0_g2~~TRINITY_DN262_c0_g2_i3.p2  ORF type:complete len:235 (+),score=25.79 TRINITY_DN262_c0_g2_i3:107-811(+)